MSGIEVGHAIIAGTRMPVIGLHMCNRRISMRILVPGGFSCEQGIVTLFGHDGVGIEQIAEPVDIPLITSEAALMDITLRIGKKE